MAVTLVGFGTLGAGTGALTGAAAPTFPTGLADGDLLLLGLEGEGEDSNADGANADWTLIGTVASATDGAADRTRCTLYYAWYSAADPPSRDIADGGNHVLAQIAAFRGVDTATPIEAQQSSSSSTNGLTHTATGLTTLTDGAMVVLVATHGDDGVSAINFSNASLASITASSAQTAQGSDGTLIFAYGIDTVAGSVDATTWNTLVSEERAAWVVALRPLGTGGEVAATPATLSCAGLAGSVTLAEGLASSPAAWALVGVQAVTLGGASGELVNLTPAAIVLAGGSFLAVTTQAVTATPAVIDLVGGSGTVVLDQLVTADPVEWALEGEAGLVTAGTGVAGTAATLTLAGGSAFLQDYSAITLTPADIPLAGGTFAVTQIQLISAAPATLALAGVTANLTMGEATPAAGATTLLIPGAGLVEASGGVLLPGAGLVELPAAGEAMAVAASPATVVLAGGTIALAQVFSIEAAPAAIDLAGVQATPTQKQAIDLTPAVLQLTGVQASISRVEEEISLLIPGAGLVTGNDTFLIPGAGLVENTVAGGQSVAATPATLIFAGGKALLEKPGIAQITWVELYVGALAFEPAVLQFSGGSFATATPEDIEFAPAVLQLAGVTASAEIFTGIDLTPATLTLAGSAATSGDQTLLIPGVGLASASEALLLPGGGLVELAAVTTPIPAFTTLHECRTTPAELAFGGVQANVEEVADIALSPRVITFAGVQASVQQADIVAATPATWTLVGGTCTFAGQATIRARAAVWDISGVAAGIQFSIGGHAGRRRARKRYIYDEESELGRLATQLGQHPPERDAASLRAAVKTGLAEIIHSQPFRVRYDSDGALLLDAINQTIVLHGALKAHVELLIDDEEALDLISRIA